MTLHLYFARKFLFALMVVMAVFFTFMLLLDLVDQVRRFDVGEVTFAQAAGLAFLNVPTTLYTILPLIVLLATLMLYLGLARTSELVVTRAAGRSALRALVTPVTVALLIGLLTVAVLNPMVAATAKEYETRRNAYNSGTSSVLSISDAGLWLRQAASEGQIVIRAARSNPDGSTLYDVTFLGFTADKGPAFRIEARQARLEDGAWALSGAKRWDLSADIANPEAEAAALDRIDLPTDLTRDRIRDSFGEPGEISIWDLPEFISNLRRAGFSPQRHMVWLQMELALPLVFVAMVMIAAGFTMRHTRFGRTGLMVLLTLVFGLGLYFLRSFAQVLGENDQIPIALAAWGPPVIGILLSMGLLLHLEDG